MALYAMILAAGEGTRMQSARPKPLHLICGRPTVMHVIHALEDLAPTRTVVVVGHGAQMVMQRVETDAPSWARISFAEQRIQRGTGDAVSAGLDCLSAAISEHHHEHDDTSTVVVLPGDTPLLTCQTLESLVAHHQANDFAATVLTTKMDDPTGYGRVIRAKDGRVIGIVEQRDATPQERTITEINTSIYAFRGDLLGPALRRVSPNNVQAEFYLTDVVAVLAAMGHQIGAVTSDASESQGVNDRWQLALAERELRTRTNRFWLLQGVTIFDTRQTFIDVDVHIGRDVTLFPGAILQGKTTIGAGCEIGPNTRLVDCTVGEQARVDNTVARQATIGARAIVGPFAHLLPGSRVHDDQTTGAFYNSSDNDS